MVVRWDYMLSTHGAILNLTTTESKWQYIQKADTHATHDSKQVGILLTTVLQRIRP